MRSQFIATTIDPPADGPPGDSHKVVGHSFNWDDLKPLLAVACAGSTLGAAKLLGLSQPTVQRRIAALEKSFGCQLVERYPSGYHLSPLGADLRIRAGREGH